MMRWSKTPRLLLSIVRMQSSSITTTTKQVHLEKSNKSNEHSIVSAAFESLKEIDNAKTKNSSFYIINNKLDNATTVEEILTIADLGLISKQHALKVIDY